MNADLKVGPITAADGTVNTARSGKAGEAIIGQLHGRFYEACYRSSLFSIGCNYTALSAATVLLTASGQPIVGVWNPSTSTVNLVLIRASLVTGLNNVTSVAPGAFIWASSLSNTSLTAGLNPFNRKTLASSGASAKAFSLSTASLMTGLTNNLTFFGAPEFNVASALLTTTVTAATPTPTVSGTQDFEGSIIVPPGGVVGLFNTISSTTHSVSARLIWEEVPV